jgi:hypothetical protein
MNVKLDSRSSITNEHSASSYGQPVLVIDGQAYGPGDLVPDDLGIPATARAMIEALESSASRPGNGQFDRAVRRSGRMTDEQRAACNAFLGR